MLTDEEKANSPELGGNDSVDLQADTGKNSNPGGVWSLLQTAVGAAPGLAAALTGKPKAKAAAAPSSFSKYLPWIAGAVALLVVLGLVLKRD